MNYYCKENKNSENYIILVQVLTKQTNKDNKMRYRLIDYIILIDFKLLVQSR